MSEGPYYTVDYGEQLNEAFPVFRCARCGNTSFSVVAPMETLLFDEMVGELKGNEEPRKLSDVLMERSAEFLGHTGNMFADVVCNRCGLSERYFAPVLIAANKPISETDGDGE